MEKTEVKQAKYSTASSHSTTSNQKSITLEDFIKPKQSQKTPKIEEKKLRHSNENVWKFSINEPDTSTNIQNKSIKFRGNEKYPFEQETIFGEFRTESCEITDISFVQLCLWLKPNSTMVKRIENNLEIIFNRLENEKVKYRKQSTFFSGTFMRGQVHVDIFLNSILELSKVMKIINEFRYEIIMDDEESSLIRLPKENVQIQFFARGLNMTSEKERKLSDYQKDLIRLIKSWCYLFTRTLIQRLVIVKELKIG